MNNNRMTSKIGYMMLGASLAAFYMNMNGNMTKMPRMLRMNKKGKMKWMKNML